MSDFNDCNVCVEPFNKSTRILVKCSYCNWEVCSKCCKTYLLGLVTESSCMNCKKNWDRKFLVSQFDRTFLEKTLKKHRQNILFDRERSLLPSTQIFVENQIKVEELDKEILALQMEIKNKQNILKQMKKDRENLLLVERRNTLQKQTKTFIRACPATSCKGFVSKNWSCGLCKKETCSECHEIRGEEHKCDPGNVETARLLARDTKPCPKCGTQIFKISGCNQMFCTQCHTAFGWTTGVIEEGVIHNPHYFELLRRGTIVAGNVGNMNPCGRLDQINGGTVMRLSNALRASGPIRNTVLEICRNLIHIREVELLRYRTNRIEDNLDLRIQYMRNLITEDNFKKMIQRREKEISKRTDVTGILQMFLAASTDLIMNFQRNLDNEIESTSLRDIWRKSFVELSQLVDYTNECFCEMQKVYGMKTDFNIDRHSCRFG